MFWIRADIHHIIALVGFRFGPGRGEVAVNHRCPRGATKDQYDIITENGNRRTVTLGALHFCDKKPQKHSQRLQADDHWSSLSKERLRITSKSKEVISKYSRLTSANVDHKHQGKHQENAKFDLTDLWWPQADHCAPYLHYFMKIRQTLEVHMICPPMTSSVFKTISTNHYDKTLVMFLYAKLHQRSYYGSWEVLLTSANNNCNKLCKIFYLSTVLMLKT